MSAWLSYPLPPLVGSREFSCATADKFTAEECAYYQHRWHFWYVADLVFAVPTVAFFLCVIGLFVIGYAINQASSHTKHQGPAAWKRLIAGVRYLSYRGYRISSLRWNSAPIGLLLLAFIGACYFLLMDLVPQPYYWPSLKWGGSPPLGTRSGWLALACMPFVFATASKANWITLVTGVTHEKLQVFHRWTAYAFMLLALMHTFPFIVYHIRFHDMVMQVTEMNTFEYWTGIVALVFQAWLTFASHSFFRKMGYEVFKFAHFFSVVIFVVVFFWHCGAALTSWSYFVATAAVYVSCLAYSWARTLFEYGGWQQARVCIESNEFIRVDIPANFDWVPGQHCFLRFGRFGLRVLSSHPFTICSTPSGNPQQQSQLTFYIRRGQGFTDRLFSFARSIPSATVPVMIDGPYGGIDLHRFVSNERALIVAGGSGAGWALPFVELFASRKAAASSACSCSAPTQLREKVGEKQSGLRSLRVILATRDFATELWFRQSVEEILSRYTAVLASSKFELEIHVTGNAEQQIAPTSLKDDLERSQISSDRDASSSDGEAELKDQPVRTMAACEVIGRPHLPTVIKMEAEKVMAARESLGIYVCGPETMQHDARVAAAAANVNIVRGGAGAVYLHLEHFSWA